jgi:hypothetical protein
MKQTTIRERETADKAPARAEKRASQLVRQEETKPLNTAMGTISFPSHEAWRRHAELKHEKTDDDSPDGRSRRGVVSQWRRIRLRERRLAAARTKLVLPISSAQDSLLHDLCVSSP